MRKTRYAHVGTGSRARLYIAWAVRDFSKTVEYVALCDTNQTRMNYHNQLIAEHTGQAVPTYKPEDFQHMIAETRPDWLIVTTPDCYHHEYIIRGMELGCNIATEKPMTTDAEKCQQILDTQKKTGKQIVVLFNYRYAPIRAKARELLQSGVIGKIRSVDFNWMLDTRHGADYFRRWHRKKQNSGGLLVHKATHHFDLVNWWIDSRPKRVFAFGSRTYALPEQAKKINLNGRGKRCLDCREKERCPYTLDLTSKPQLRALYLSAEHEDHYYRDRCVFDADIDIEDQMSVTVEYENGVQMAYSLNNFVPWEGYRLVVNGTQGRLEMNVQESSYVSGDGSTQGALKENATSLKVFPMFAEPYDIVFEGSKGGHGGGDRLVVQNLFFPSSQPDPLCRAANHIDGALSILTGIAANQSMETGQAVDVGLLVSF